jgi:integrase
MLTDTKLRTLKPKDKEYKVADRDGLYVQVLTSGTLSFRYNYRLNGRGETVTFGRYGVITLAQARDKLDEAKKLIAEGKSPSREKVREKARDSESKTFDQWAQAWLKGYEMAETTRDHRTSTYRRHLQEKFGSKLLHEISHEDLRSLTDKIVASGAPTSAVHAREIVMLIYRWAIERGQNVENPADRVRPASIAKVHARERALSPDEIKLMYEYLEKVSSGPQFKAASRLLLLTLVRKGELTGAKWSEVSFTNALWTIPKERTKKRRDHLVPLSNQALEIFLALKTFAGGSEFVLPSRYDADAPMSPATLNKTLELVYKLAQKEGKDLAKFGPHDLRRTGSTLLHEASYNTDWIEKQLAHEQQGVRAVYNKAEYLEQRREMLQDWADMIDGWTKRQPE